MKTLRQIESRSGKLDRATVSRCKQYAAEVLGSKIYTPWLYVYSAMAGEFREGWIPDNYFERFVVPAMMGAYGKISFLKPFAGNIFHSPCFPDLCSYVNGLWFDNDRIAIAEDRIVDFLFRDNEKVVFKTDENSYQGLGVYFFARDNFDLALVKDKGNGVFQKFIRQHPFFHSIMPDSVGTLRFTTVVGDDGQISLRSCIYRVARSNESHVCPDNELVIIVDVDTGEFSPTIYMPDYQTVTEHPDTGFNFSGKRVVCYDQCKQVVFALHRMIPQVRCVGWDLTVDENEEIQVMEWNGGHTDIKFIEAVQGPCFADLGWNRLHLNNRQPDFAF